MQILFGRGNWKTERGEETFRIAFILFSLRRNRELFCPYFEGRILDPVLFPLQHDLETGEKRKRSFILLFSLIVRQVLEDPERGCVREGGGRFPGEISVRSDFSFFPLFQKKGKRGEKDIKRIKWPCLFLLQRCRLPRRPSDARAHRRTVVLAQWSWEVTPPLLFA